MVTVRSGTLTGGSGIIVHLESRLRIPMQSGH